MVICIFGNTVVKPGMEEAEARLADKLAAILRKMPGFISSKSYVEDRGSSTLEPVVDPSRPAVL